MRMRAAMYALILGLCSGNTPPIAAIASAADVDRPVMLLKDTVGGSSSGISPASTFVRVGREIFFTAVNGDIAQRQLWRTTGRTSGTYALSGTQGIFSNPVAIPDTSCVLFFVGSGYPSLLKSYDARTGNVVILRDNASPSMYQSLLSTPSLQRMGGFARAGSHALFLSQVGAMNALWTTDGTVAGTRLIGQPTGEEIRDITPAGRYAYFTTRTSFECKLWRTDGTPMSAALMATLTTFPSGSVEGSCLRALGDSVLFSIPTGVYDWSPSDVWVSDGTSTGTHAVTRLPTRPTVLPFANGGGGVFSVRGTGTTTEMWHLSPVQSGCVKLMDFSVNSRFQSFGSYGNLSVFGDAPGNGYYNTASAAITLWVTDGTPQNTLAVVGFPGLPSTGSGGAPANLMVGDTLFLASNAGGAGYEPWRMNMSSGVIGLLRDIVPGGASSNPSGFFQWDGDRGAGFVTQDVPGRSSLYFSDGTPAGTRLVSHLAGLTATATVQSIVSRVLIVANGIVNGASTGFEPYAIDLCPADYDNSGTVSVGDIFAYLNDWLIGSSDAELVGPPGTVDIADLIAFINVWMTPCEP